MYKINDYVIYKREVCVVKDLKKINNQDYYTLENKEDTSLKISIPVSQETQLLRHLATFDEISNTLDHINEIPTLDINERNLEEQYKLLLQGTTIENLIKIIKTAYIRNEIRKNNHKHLSDTDTSYQELAEQFLFNEIAYAMNISYDAAKELVFNKLVNIVDLK
ncbi:putative uncharacterized protein [Mycoplasma sp. CAG:956]|nr:putative uncharacterized protein [Mycoplasma sp. CAG:956]